MVEDDLIPVDRFRPIVERWLAQFENAEEGFRVLEASSPIRADTWRRRLSEDTYPSRRTGSELVRGWFAMIRLDIADVDEFLTAADLTDLWHTELRDLFPEGRESAEDFDARCAVCDRWIDWEGKPWSGVRVELKRPRKWMEWWSVCAFCVARCYTPPRRPGCTGLFNSLIPEAAALDLYRRYLDDEIGIGLLADEVWKRFGFASAKSCAISITHAWQRDGWPMRDRVASKRLNGKHRHRKLGHRIPEADLRSLHVLHMRGEKLSAFELARRTYEKYGYKRCESMHRSMLDGWKLLGLKARGRIEMCVAMSTTNGLSPRDHKERSRRRREAGLTSHGRKRQPDCVATNAKGKRCTRPRTRGRDYCYSHDPATAQARLEHLQLMWSRSPTGNVEISAWEPIRRELLAAHEYLGGGLDAWEAIAVAMGVTRDTIRSYASDRDRRVSTAKAAQLRSAIQTATDNAAELIAA